MTAKIKVAEILKIIAPIVLFSYIPSRLICIINPTKANISNEEEILSSLEVHFLALINLDILTT